MPRYFIDYQEGNSFHEDAEGSNLSSIENAQREAISLISEFVKFVVPETGNHEIIATVRDESDTRLYRATLAYRGECLNKSDVLTLVSLAPATSTPPNA